MHTIIDSIELVGIEMTYVEVAQTENETLIDEINLDYDSTLGQWIETNIIGLEDGTILISEFFNTTPLVHIARTTISAESNLPIINSIGEL
tara:strand:+ start:16244 stop:16516 length:273 start_codon:yes stop_codon:yes gene_type:complete